MGIYIKNMEMPEFGEKIIILTSSGYVEDVSGQVINGIEAMPVPEHGRLIDADALVHSYYHAPSFPNLCKAINDASTIIPADSDVKDYPPYLDYPLK